MSLLFIYIDSWCPICVRFGGLLKRLDIFHKIEQADIRLYQGNLVCKEQALKVIASVNRHSIVFYGFDSIFQILLRLPLLWWLVPLFFVLKVSRIGHWCYNELAEKRQIIPLQCKEEDCNLN